MSTPTHSEHTEHLADETTRYASDAATVAERGMDAVQAAARQARDNTVRAARYVTGGATGSRLMAGVLAAAVIAAVTYVVRRSRNRLE